uniref:Uncharacterized protein n=1 Tax=Cucumis sativus TaxID=3659 RepID=A0A0A0K668_CUCSA
MAVARCFKLLPTLFLVFVWQYCAKVGASGFFDDFDSGSFGSSGVGMLVIKNRGVAPNSNMIDPKELAPETTRPIETKTTQNKDNKDSSSNIKITANNRKIGTTVSYDRIKTNMKIGGNIDLFDHGRIIIPKIQV